MVMTSVHKIKQMAVMDNFKRWGLVITTYLEAESIVITRTMIPK